MEDKPIISPDGNYLWTGEEWTPIPPPLVSSELFSIDNEYVIWQESLNLKQNRIDEIHDTMSNKIPRNSNLVNNNVNQNEGWFYCAKCKTDEYLLAKQKKNCSICNAIMFSSDNTKDAEKYTAPVIYDQPRLDNDGAGNENIGESEHWNFVETILGVFFLLFLFGAIAQFQGDFPVLPSSEFESIGTSSETYSSGAPDGQIYSIDLESVDSIFFTGKQIEIKTTGSSEYVDARGTVYPLSCDELWAGGFNAAPLPMVIRGLDTQGHEFVISAENSGNHCLYVVTYGPGEFTVTQTDDGGLFGSLYPVLDFGYVLSIWVFWGVVCIAPIWLVLATLWPDIF